MDDSTESEPGPLRVGYGRVDITPALGCHLAGVVDRHGRVCTRIRDPLHARAIQLSTDNAQAYIVAADLLLTTDRLHAAVAARAGVAPEQLLLSATHNHSGPGGYWDLGRGKLFMGPFRQGVFDRLVDAMALAIEQARQTRPVMRVRASSSELAGVSANRRQLHGPVDPEMVLVRFELSDAPPIEVVSFGAHPVVGCEREPGVCSADFPGELCARLEQRGSRPLFFTGAVGGLSPLFTEFPVDLDQHLQLLGDLLELGVERAAEGLVEVAAADLDARTIDVRLPAPSCSIFPPGQRWWRLANLAATPLRRFLLGMAREARGSDRARLPLIRLGEVAWLGTPCDLGVNVALALKAVLHRAGAAYALVGSQCNGYVGYVHLPEDYDHVPETGFRHMAFYENAMSLSGFHLGRAFVEALQENTCRPLATNAWPTAKERAQPESRTS